MSLKVTFSNSAIYGNKNRENDLDLRGLQVSKRLPTHFTIYCTPHHLSNIARNHQQKAKDFLSSTATKFWISLKSDDHTDDDVSIFSAAQLSATGTILVAFTKQHEQLLKRITGGTTLEPDDTFKSSHNMGDTVVAAACPRQWPITNTVFFDTVRQNGFFRGMLRGHSDRIFPL